jgi:hypothetical protein
MVLVGLFVMITISLGVAYGGDEWAQPLRPVSNEVAKLGPGMKPECQDELEVWGIGMHKDKDKVEANALLDARRAACWYVLFGGDGILKTEEQRNCFERLADQFYSETTVRQFVPWVSDVFDRRKLEKKGRKIKLKVRVNVDHCLIKTWLEDNGCEITPPSLMSIMVLPDVARDVSPIDELEQDPDKRMAKSVIENFMTQEGTYQLLEPDATITREQIIEATDLIEDNPGDLVYRLALMQGADIYFRFEVMFENPIVHSQRMQKVIVRLEAYETATALKLGSQTAYSETRPMSVTSQALIEEAVSSGTRDILNRIQTYWLKEIKRGVQYIMVMVISDEADEDDAIDIQDCFVDCADEVSKASKLDIMTSGRIQYRVWVDGEEIDNVNRLGRAFRKCFQELCDEWKVRPKNQIGKLFQGHIVMAD